MRAAPPLLRAGPGPALAGARRAGPGGRLGACGARLGARGALFGARGALLGLALLLLGTACGLVDRDLPAAQAPLPAPARHPRFGVSAVDPGRADLAASGAGWYLDWTEAPTPGVALEFVPVVCAYPDVNPPTPAARARLAARVAADRRGYPPGTLFVVGNEIGYRPQRDSRLPARYAQDFQACRDALRGVDPSFRFATGPVVLSRDPRATAGYVEGRDGLDYLGRVLDAYQAEYGEPLAPDFVAATAHVLAGDGVDVEVFREQVVALRRLLAERGLRGSGVVLTEVGAAIGRPSPEAAEAFLRETLSWLADARDPELGCPGDEDRLVQRFAWFTAHPLGPLRKLRLLGLAAFAVDLGGTSLFRSDGTPSVLAAAYAAAARGGPAPRARPPGYTAEGG